jgi:hypothetical protein
MYGPSVYQSRDIRYYVQAKSRECKIDAVTSEVAETYDADGVARSEREDV